MTLDELKKTASLDIIIEKMLESGESVPDFVKKHEQRAADEIEAYTSKITGRVGDGLRELSEENYGELISCIQNLGRSYFKNGMEAGAVLLMQLIGL